MLTVEERNEIVKLAFKAIRALYGSQEKLKMVAYSEIEYIIQLRLHSGWFQVDAESGESYKFKLDDYDTITSLSKGKLEC